MILIFRFCYFSENILSLKSYYQLSHVFVWLMGISLIIPNILIKRWNADFHLVLDWSNAAWPVWWLKQSIKSSKLNVSVSNITYRSCVYLFICVWVFCFLKVNSLALNYTKATGSRVGLVSWPFLNIDFRYGM